MRVPKLATSPGRRHVVTASERGGQLMFLVNVSGKEIGVSNPAGRTEQIAHNGTENGSPDGGPFLCQSANVSDPLLVPDSRARTRSPTSRGTIQA